MITLEIPRIPASPNEMRRFHWRHRYRHDQIWKQEIGYAVVSKRPAVPFPRAKVTIDRRSRGSLDPDNLVSSMKPVIDALRHSRIIENDTADHIQLTVTQSRDARLPPRTLIEITPIEETT